MCKLIAIVGETASGKSSLAITIAQKHNGEIISADSRTIYKGMDIGTAKPTANEMMEVAHYGFDLVDPDKTYTAAQYQSYAREKISDICSRGKTPILVGGTGLYVDAVLFGYSFGEAVDTNIRSQLNNKSVAELATLAKKEGIHVDSQTLKNKRHLIRLIERGGERQQDTELQYDALIIGVNVPRSELRKRIEKRVEVMFRKGLRKEYNELRSIYDLKSEAFSGIGYREFRDAEHTDTSMSEVKRQIVRNTIHLAKRQRTWFKRNRHIQWVDDVVQAEKRVDDFLS